MTPSVAPRPIVSVCSTNYNCGHALREHLETVYDHLGGLNFEYVMVDNFSKDDSPSILREWSQNHDNFSWIQRRSSRGRGRNLAVRASQAPWILIVDTDTLYFRIVRAFVDACMDLGDEAVTQAIYAGMYPRALWEKVGGLPNMNIGEDLEMWMQLWMLGKIRWYPVKMGENMKESHASDRLDFMSSRYGRLERLRRLFRSEFDMLLLARYEKMNLDAVWRENTLDLGLGPMEEIWFGHAASPTMLGRLRSFARRGLTALRA